MKEKEKMSAELTDSEKEELTQWMLSKEYVYQTFMVSCILAHKPHEESVEELTKLAAVLGLDYTPQLIKNFYGYTTQIIAVYQIIHPLAEIIDKDIDKKK